MATPPSPLPQGSPSRQSRRQRAGFVPSLSTTDETPPRQSRDMQRPSLLTNEEPLDALCHHFNVSKVALRPGVPPPTAIDMPVLRDTHMPTHALAAIESDADPSIQPLILPIDAELYGRGFRVEILPQSPPGTISPVPHFVPQSQSQAVTLPIVPIHVPHIASLPLLLLFSLGLETQTNLMAWRLLPPQVIEEFPNAAAMAQVMARLSDDQMRRYVANNHGLWKNVLALGPRDTRIVELVQTAWNVTAEARRIRQRERLARQ